MLTSVFLDKRKQYFCLSEVLDNILADTTHVLHHKYFNNI